MTIEEIRDQCLLIKGAKESFDKVIVNFKVMDKVFAFYPIKFKNNEHFFVIKCDPEKTTELREKYIGVTKGYYTGNTLKWNSVYLNKDVPDKVIKELINNSVNEVIKSLPKYKQEEYFNKKETNDKKIKRKK